MRCTGILLMLASCGRIGFGIESDGDGGAGDDGPSDDGGTDADGGAEGLATFGERPEAMFREVTRDTYLSNESGESSLNYGGDDEVRLERDVDERGLIRFDVSALPPGTTVLTATLDLVAIQVPAVGSATIDVRPLREDWQEGGQADADGVANFTFRMALIPWSLPGASPPASSDPIITSFDVSALGPVDVTLPSSLVQGWIDAPTQNHGVLLVSQHDESTRFVAREGPLADRPMLTITFMP